MQDLNDKVTGGTLTATEWNEVPSEIQNVIEALGITLSSGDLNQLGKAIAGYVANATFYTDSGAADAYVLTTIGSKQSLTAYTDGATFEFIAGNPGTGAATVNVAGLGVKNIKLSDGTDPAAGDITGRTVLRFDSGNDRCELIQVPFIGLNPELKTRVASSWVSFVGTGTVSIRDSFNVRSITDFGTGDYQVNFATALADANYAYAASLKADNDSVEAKIIFNQNSDLYTAAALRVQAAFANDTSTGAIDVPIGNIMTFGGV